MRVPWRGGGGVVEAEGGGADGSRVYAGGGKRLPSVGVKEAKLRVFPR